MNNLTIHKRSDGRYVPAVYIHTKSRFRALLTVNGEPNEADSLEGLKYARSYSSVESLKRALRKKRKGELS